MSAAASIGGWALGVVACAIALELWRRLELVARAEHELRGPATALLLAWERMLGEAPGRDGARPLGTQLLRLEAGLLDLTAARSGRRPAARLEHVRLATLLGGEPGGRGSADGSGRPGTASGDRPTRDRGAAPEPAVLADRGRAAQALGNLLSNASQHGRGDASVRTRAAAGGVEIEVRNRAVDRPGPPRGRRRGLRIARDAARSTGGELHTAREGEEFAAVLRLPLPERDDDPPTAA